MLGTCNLKITTLYFLIAIYRKMTKVWQISKLTILVTSDELQPHVVAWLDLKTILVRGEGERMGGKLQKAMYDLIAV